MLLLTLVTSTGLSVLAELRLRQNTTALVFPVYTKGTNTIGYTVANGNTELPCFYLWGMQKDDKKANAMQVQIRYKLNGSSEEHTSMTFNIYAPDSNTENGVKKFDEGYAYNAIITLTGDNKTGGSTGKEWNNGGVLPTDNGTCPNTGGASEHICPTSVTGGKTPLEFVAEYDVNNAPAGQKALRTSHSLPPVVDDGYGPYVDITKATANDVGYYNWEDAKALFDGSNPALANYYLPSQSQWFSIIPSGDPKIYFWSSKSITSTIEDAQIGELPIKNYSAEYVTIREGDFYVTYALRFKGTEWESAWRYSYEGADGNKQMIIKSVGGLKGLGIRLDCIITPEFFVNNPSTIRILSAYGSTWYDKGQDRLSGLGSSGDYWSSTPYGSGSTYYLNFNSYNAYVGGSSGRTHGYTVRPFVRN